MFVMLRTRYMSDSDIGRGVSIPAKASAIASPSNTPTQMGRTRSPSRSLSRTTRWCPTLGGGRASGGADPPHIAVLRHSNDEVVDRDGNHRVLLTASTACERD